MPFLKVAALLLLWKQRLLVRGLGPHFHEKNVAKKSQMFISLPQAKYNIANWHFYHHSSSLWYIQFCLGVNVNTPIDYSSRYSFGHFCCRVKQGKRLSEFLQKYTDSGTETTHLAGYNILYFKYVNISAGLPLLSIGAILERSSKIRYCIIWRGLHLMFTTTTVSEKWNKRCWTEQPPFSSWAGHLRGKLKRPLASSRVNHWEIALYSSFYKDVREKSMENNGD